MNEQKNFLTIDEVITLLSDEYVFDKENDKIGKSAYKTKCGETLPIHNSKLYPNESFWYNVLIDVYVSLGVKRVCLTCGNEGILLLPIEILTEYTKMTNWKQQAKGRSYFVRIRKNGYSLQLYGYEEGLGNAIIDVSEFYQSKK